MSYRVHWHKIGFKAAQSTPIESVEPLLACGRSLMILISQKLWLFLLPRCQMKRSFIGLSQKEWASAEFLRTFIQSPKSRNPHVPAGSQLVLGKTVGGNNLTPNEGNGRFPEMQISLYKLDNCRKFFFLRLNEKWDKVFIKKDTWAELSKSGFAEWGYKSTQTRLLGPHFCWLCKAT